MSEINQIKSAFQKFIIQPSNSFGLGGFAFDLEIESTVNLSADITDHFTENNTAIQDHIAVKPASITLRNFVGELVDRRESETLQAAQEVLRKLTILNSFLPDITQAAQQARSFIDDSAQDISFGFPSRDVQDRALNLWALTKNLNPAASRQQQAYLYFKSLMTEKILVSVQTPFEFLTNMAVEQIVAVQPENSRFISDFSITLKQIRFARTEEAEFDARFFQGRAQQQRQPVSENAKVSGETVNRSILLDLGVKTYEGFQGLTGQ